MNHKSGADVNAQSSSGRTPLLEATMNGSYECAEVLLEAGTNLELLDVKGTSVLHYICFERTTNIEFLKLVLKGTDYENMCM